MIEGRSPIFKRTQGKWRIVASRATFYAGDPGLNAGRDVVQIREVIAARKLEQIPLDDKSDQIRLSAHLSGQSISAERIRALEVAEQTLLSNFKDWARKLGIVSFDKVAIRELAAVPRFAQCNWDFVAPSYAYPLVRKNLVKTSPGFVVADVSLANPFGEKSIAYFLRKCRLTRSVPTYPPFMALLISDSFTSQALKRCRQDVVLAVTVQNLFGADIAQALMQLVQTLSNAAQAVIADPDRVFELINKLSKIEGAAVNLRGALFEMLCAYCLKKAEGLNVKVGVRAAAPDTSKIAEIDVLGELGNVAIVACECKGYPHTSTLPVAEIKKWLAKLPTILSWIHTTRPQHSQMKKRFELWTPGELCSEGRKLLADAKKHSGKQYVLHWKSGVQVRDRFKSLNEKSVSDTLRQHYFN